MYPQPVVHAFQEEVASQLLIFARGCAQQVAEGEGLQGIMVGGRALPDKRLSWKTYFPHSHVLWLVASLPWAMEVPLSQHLHVVNAESTHSRASS